MPAILLIMERSDPEAISLLRYEIRKAFTASGDTVEIGLALDEEDAKAQLPGDFSLVITPLQIRKTAMDPLSQDDEQALDLLQWMSSNRMNLPSILITPTYTDKLVRAMPSLGRCFVVKSGTDMISQVVKAAAECLRDAPTKCLDIEIQLRSAKTWGYRIHGQGFPYEHEDEVAIDARMLEDLRDLTDALGGERWINILSRIGHRLMEMMSGGGSPFLADVLEGVLQAGGEQNTRLRFAVTPELHPLPLEAVTCPRLRDRHWMLQAPVYRRLLVDEPSSGGFLFEGGQKINCLIIDASTSGWVDDLNLRLGRLDHASSECDWLAGWLRQRMGDYNLAEPVLLRARPGEKPLWQQVKEQLESRDWGIVHYAGHSYCTSDAKTGYTFFPGASEGSIEKVPLMRFSDALRRVTFTYFSSCDSGAGPFVFELANRRVSNILGFRWEINDEYASEYVQEFYQSLFEKRSLERAFLKARQTMHATHPDDRIWAAPILIKQLGD